MLPCRSELQRVGRSSSFKWKGGWQASALLRRWSPGGAHRAILVGHDIFEPLPVEQNSYVMHWPQNYPALVLMPYFFDDRPIIGFFSRMRLCDRLLQDGTMCAPGSKQLRAIARWNRTLHICASCWRRWG